MAIEVLLAGSKERAWEVRGWARAGAARTRPAKRPAARRKVTGVLMLQTRVHLSGSCRPSQAGRPRDRGAVDSGPQCGSHYRGGCHCRLDWRPPARETAVTFAKHVALCSWTKD